MQLGECQALPSQPACEVAQQAEVLSHGRAGIAQSLEGSDERVQVRGEQVTSVEFCGRTAWKGLLEHGSSPLWVMGCPQRKGCPDYAASSSRGANHRAEKLGRRTRSPGRYRHNPGVGIMPKVVKSWPDATDGNDSRHGLPQEPMERVPHSRIRQPMAGGR